jgi:hypothetical protein
MASTRNINTKNNYNLEQRINSNFFNYSHYENSSSGRAYSEAMPCFGIYPSKLSMNTLSNNPIDIESQLRGIGSTNLVMDVEEVKPDLKTLNGISFYERLPLYIPQPLVIEMDQRPLRR